jgi:hypothetical protein
MKKINEVEIYYDKAKDEFGTTDHYCSGKTEIDFICMLRDKFKNSINDNGDEVELSGRKYAMEDLSIYLASKIDTVQDNSRYDNIPIILLTITISTTGLFKLIPDSVIDKFISMQNGILVISSLIAFIIFFALFYLEYFDRTAQKRHIKNSAIKGFYKLSYDILQQEKGKKIKDIK